MLTFRHKGTIDRQKIEEIFLNPNLRLVDSDNKVNSWMVKKKFPKLNFLIVFLAWARKIQKRVQKKKKKKKKKKKEEEIGEILFELEKDL